MVSKASFLVRSFRLQIEESNYSELRLAQFVKFSGYHERNDRLAPLGTVGWEDWSAFEDIIISTARGSYRLCLQIYDG
jgi:long-subunit fatty acid transport protein